MEAGRESWPNPEISRSQHSLCPEYKRTHNRAHLTDANSKPIRPSSPGCRFHIHFRHPAVRKLQKTIRGVNLKVRGNGGSDSVHSFSLPLISSLSLSSRLSHLCSSLLLRSPPLLPSVPFPLFSSCCVILILHTLLLWTMNNAWCVRNPQCHAWLPASITGLASLLRR